MSWYEKTFRWYAAVWAASLLLTLAGVTIYVHEHYAYQTYAGSWQHAMDRWPYTIFIFVLIAFAQVPVVLATTGAFRKLNAQPEGQPLLRYIVVTAAVSYLLWTLTFAMGPGAVFFAPVFAVLFLILAAAGSAGYVIKGALR